MVVKGKNSFAFQLNSYSQWRCNHKYCCHIITAFKSDWSGLWSTIHPLAENLIRDNCDLAWGTPTPRSLPRLIVIMDIQLHECMNSSIGVSDSTKLDNCTCPNNSSYLVPLFYFQMLEGKQKSHLKLHDQNGRPGQLQFFRPMDNYQKV